MNTFEPTLIKASAGTGKTFRLTNRFIQLLVAGEVPENILATTFSVKAAGEIRDRVFQRIANAATSLAGAKKLSDELGKPVSMQQAQDILENLIKKQHRLNISTLDSFFHKILSTFALELGVAPNWSLDTTSIYDFNSDVVEKICNAQNISELVTLLQVGDYKTRFMKEVSFNFTAWYSIFRQAPSSAWNWIKLDKNYSAEDIAEIEEAFREADFPETKRQAQWEAHVQKDLENLWETNFNPSGLCKKALEGDYSFYKVPFTESLVSAYSAYKKYRTWKLLFELNRKNVSTERLLTIYDEEYRNLRAARSTVSFADITHILQKASFREDIEYIYYRLDTKIRHLLLDEFQDTSYPQWQILEPIAAEILSQSGLERSFFCVGDVKQAIYGWRGGVSAIFDTLEKRWQLDIRQQNESFRCSQPVLNCVNQVFSNITMFPTNKYEVSSVLKEWTKNFYPHSSKCKDADFGYVTYEIMPKVAKEEDDDEAFYKRLCTITINMLCRHPEYKIGILCRSNNTITEIASAFARYGGQIPISIEGKKYLTVSPAVRVCLAFLHLLDHPSDTLAAFHVATTPLGQVLGLEDWHIRENPQDISTRCLEWRKQISEIGYGQFFSEIAQKLKDLCSPQELKNVFALAELGFSYSDWTNPRCEEFAKLVRDTEISDVQESSVVVMTIHKSKGLEFDAVILPELSRPIFSGGAKELLALHEDIASPPLAVSHLDGYLMTLDPTVEKMYAEKRKFQVTEALCVLYVAMTRAKKELYMLAKPFAVNNDRSLAFTYASLLYITLVSFSPSKDILTGIVYSQGRVVPAANAVEKQESALVQILPKVTIPQKREFARMQTNNPSKLEGWGKVSLSNLLSTTNRSALNIGSLVHAMMQSIEWLDDSLALHENFDLLYQYDDVVAEVVRQLRCSEAEIKQAQTLFQQALKSNAVCEALSKKRYGTGAEVRLYREQRFSIVDSKSSILSGAFDRLVAICRDGKPVKGEVIDFKTDKFTDNLTLQDKVEHYRPQLLAYRLATAKFLNIAETDVALSLLFIRSGDVVSI